jgi:2-iminobutanoate/2-iminopropanoate deaminase
VKQIINSLKAPKAIGPYSQAVKAGNLIFVSGQIPIDPATGEEQTEWFLKNLSAILDEAGSSLGNVIKTTVYLTDLKNFEGMNKVYARFFEEMHPARATVGVTSLPKNVEVEIEAVSMIMD